MDQEQTFVISHPYYPQHVRIANFEPNLTPIPLLLGAFGSILGIVVFTALAVAKRTTSGLRTGNQAVFCWFVLCQWTSSVMCSLPAWRQYLG